MTSDPRCRDPCQERVNPNFQGIAVGLLGRLTACGRFTARRIRPGGFFAAARTTAAFTAALAIACLLQATPGLPARARLVLRGGVLDTSRSRRSKRPWGHSPRRKCRTATQRRGSALDAPQWIRAGLRSASSSSRSRLFFEVNAEQTSIGCAWAIAGSTPAKPSPYPCAGVLTARGVWQVFAGGKPISGPIYLNHPRRLRPAAAAER